MQPWLIRTANNIIGGPYSRNQVVQLIQEGKLGPQDEVCQANHYWIFLHEQAEVESQLGIQMPRTARGDDDEITETQTDSVSVTPGVNSAVELTLATLPPMPSDYEGGTAVLSHGTFRDAKSTVSGSAVMRGSSIPEAHEGVVGASALERPSLWRSLVWFMVAAGLVIVFVVLHLLRTG